MAVTKNKICIGDSDNPIIFENNNLVSCTITRNIKIISDELPISTVEATVIFDDDPIAFAPSDYDYFQSSDGQIMYVQSAYSTIVDFDKNLPLHAYSDDYYLGKFFITNVTKNGKNKYTIVAQDFIGVLDSDTYYGLYTAKLSVTDIIKKVLYYDTWKNTTLLTDAVSQWLYDNVSFQDELSTTYYSGFVPMGTRREVLQKILFAFGLICAWDDDHYIICTPTYLESHTIDSDKIYKDGKIEYSGSKSLVSLTQYDYSTTTTAVDAYTATDEESSEERIVVFNNSNYAAYKSCYSSSTDKGFKIIGCTPYAAKISGNGTVHSTAACALKKSVYSYGDSDASNTVSVSDCEMVVPGNVESIAKNLYKYYSGRHEVSQDIVSDGLDQTGQLNIFENPFEEKDSGFLEEAVMTMSGINKVSAKYLCNFTPISHVFSNCALLTGSGIYTIPDEAIDTGRIKVILIGGGAGGDSGYAGEDGEACTSRWSAGDGGDGGNYGENGSGGKVFDVVIEGDNIAEAYSYSCGVGGAGGLACSSNTANNPGSAGGNTVFGAYTSASGISSTAGVINPITGITYALKHGDTPFKCAGGKGGYTTVTDNIRYWYAAGTAFIAYPFCKYNGALKSGEYLYNNGGSIDNGIQSSDGYIAGFSCGGGAAAGNNGENGVQSTMNGTVVTLGNGGAGGDAIAQISAEECMAKQYDGSYDHYYYGDGGLGGNGGGGGGCSATLTTSTNYTAANTPQGGKGGKGGAGGSGAPGCIIILW